MIRSTGPPKELTSFDSHRQRGDAAPTGRGSTLGIAGDLPRGNFAMTREVGYQIGVVDRFGKIISRLTGDFTLDEAESKISNLELSILAVGFTPSHEPPAAPSPGPVRRRSRS